MAPVSTVVAPSTYTSLAAIAAKSREQSRIVNFIVCLRTATGQGLYLGAEALAGCVGDASGKTGRVRETAALVRVREHAWRRAAAAWLCAAEEAHAWKVVGRLGER